MAKRKKKLLLTNYQSPGDITMLTAAVRDIHRNHPNKYYTDVDTSCKEIWENNPNITSLNWSKKEKEIHSKENIEGDKDIQVIKCEYPLVNNSNKSAYHFIHGFTQYLEEKLNIRIRLTEFKGDIHLSKSEKLWMSQVEETGVKDKFWLVVSGGKYDFTAKWWNPFQCQAVINHFKDKITFVQIGEKHGLPPDGHWQPGLNNTIDLRGKTNLRQLIRLMYHAVGVLCPITLPMHLAAAVEMKHKLNDKPTNRACVVLAGGREPMQWEAYPYHQFIHSNGTMDCCMDGGCWKSRCQLVGDEDIKDKENICPKPVRVIDNFHIPECMYNITAEDVIHRIKLYYIGGALRYNGDNDDKPERTPDETTGQGRSDTPESNRGSTEPERNQQEHPIRVSKDTIGPQQIIPDANGG